MSSDNTEGVTSMRRAMVIDYLLIVAGLVCIGGAIVLKQGARASGGPAVGSYVAPKASAKEVARVNAGEERPPPDAAAPRDAKVQDAAGPFDQGVSPTPDPTAEQFAAAEKVKGILAACATWKKKKCAGRKTTKWTTPRLCKASFLTVTGAIFVGKSPGKDGRLSACFGKHKNTPEGQDPLEHLLANAGAFGESAPCNTAIEDFCKKLKNDDSKDEK